MNLRLKRYPPDPDGIFGVLYDEEGVEVCETLEHTFDGKPALPPGVYPCVRGEHRLKNLVPFITFEVTSVEGHSGILFHCGNYNADSRGCVLVGDNILMQSGTPHMITGSRLAFRRFMELQADLDHFTLTVE